MELQPEKHPIQTGTSGKYWTPGAVLGTAVTATFAAVCFKLPPGSLCHLQIQTAE